MPQITTTNFGRIDYDEKDIVRFPEGIPAFETEHRFLLVEKSESVPVVFLQSLSRPDLAFITLPVNTILSDYQIGLSAYDRKVLKLDDSTSPDPGSLLCLAIVTITDSAPPTANLLAPVVINMTRQLGHQVIQTEPCYSHQMPLKLREELCS